MRHVLNSCLNACLFQGYEAELNDLKTDLDKIRETGRKLSDNTKDMTIRTELKNKLSSVEKLFQEAEKKIGELVQC